MKSSIKNSLLLCMLMGCTAVLGYIATPTNKMADSRSHFDLEQQIPKVFGDWQIDPHILPLQVDPDTQARLNRIYNQTLSRTYVNSSGVRVMLSIAYGGDQSDNMGVHKPEICYVAQGFEVRKNTNAALDTNFGRLPVRQLLAVFGERSEPITYWITVGDVVPEPGMSQRLQELRIGLTGTVPDGMLVRVSTIDTDLPHAYSVQKEFVNAMLAQMPSKDRARLIGDLLR